MTANLFFQAGILATTLAAANGAGAQGVQRSVDDKGRTTYSDAGQERRTIPPQRPVSQAPAPAPVPGQPQYGTGGPVIDYSGRYSNTPAPGFRTSGSRTVPSHVHEKSLDQRVNEHNQRLEANKARDQAARDAAEQRERDRQLREARARVENDKRKLRELQYENDRR